MFLDLVLFIYLTPFFPLSIVGSSNSNDQSSIW